MNANHRNGRRHAGEGQHQGLLFATTAARPSTLATKIAGGEISVYAASIPAGLRKAPATKTKWTKAETYMQNVDA